MARAWNERADELVAEAYRAGEPTAWFDRLYAEGTTGEIQMPWDRTDPHPLLAGWADQIDVAGNGRRAVVVGCGLGADAVYLAGRGFATTGFDLAPAAIAEAQRRHPDSAVDFQVADLLALPADWAGAFDLVVEIYTLQAIPDPPRTDAAAGVRSLVAPGGGLLLIEFRDDGGDTPDGPPYPLSARFVSEMAADGLQMESLESLDGPFWRAEYRR